MYFSEWILDLFISVYLYVRRGNEDAIVWDGKIISEQDYIAFDE